MREYEDGTTIEINREKLSIVVYEEPNEGSVEILGFESLSDIDLFLDFGDFTEGENNDFYTIAGKRTQLTWVMKN
jgi:hypothetical protein